MYVFVVCVCDMCRRKINVLDIVYSIHAIS
jgi:hypothetical protein